MGDEQVEDVEDVDLVARVVLLGPADLITTVEDQTTRETTEPGMAGQRILRETSGFHALYLEQSTR